MASKWTEPSRKAETPPPLNEDLTAPATYDPAKLYTGAQDSGRGYHDTKRYFHFPKMLLGPINAIVQSDRVPEIRSHGALTRAGLVRVTYELAWKVEDPSIPKRVTSSSMLLQLEEEQANAEGDMELALHLERQLHKAYEPWRKEEVLNKIRAVLNVVDDDEAASKLKTMLGER